MNPSDLLTRFDALKSARANFDTLFDEAHRYAWPEAGDILEKRTPGEKRGRQYIYDDTATLGVETFAAAMEAFLTPRTQQWHRLRVSDESLNKASRVKSFFETLNDDLFKARNAPKARFYGQTHEHWKSLGVDGNGCTFVDERPTGGIRYRFTPVGQTWIETNPENLVDTAFYTYELSAKAAVQKWGDEAPKRARDMVDTQPFDKMSYLHVVKPNDDYDPERADGKGKEFSAHELCIDSQEMIGEESGYEEFPYIWSRYTVNPAEMYGRGPIMMVMRSIKTLQEMKKTFLRAGHKVADPPLLVADDGKLGRGSKRIRLEHGGLNFGGIDDQGRQKIAALQTGARLDLTEEMMEKERITIRNALLNDLFELMVQDRVQMTATEVLERAKQRGQLLTPVIGRQQSEFLGPLVEREVGILQRQGKVGELPPELLEAEGEYEIEYESDATRMQKSDEIAAFARLIEISGPLLEADPNLFAKFKGEDIIEHYAEDLGVPAKLIKSVEEMREVHARQQQAAQARQLAEQAPPVAAAVRDISQVAA